MQAAGLFEHGLRREPSLGDGAVRAVERRLHRLQPRAACAALRHAADRSPRAAALAALAVVAAAGRHPRRTNRGGGIEAAADRDVAPNVDELGVHPILARLTARAVSRLTARQPHDQLLEQLARLQPRARLALRAAAEEPVREAVAAREARLEGVALGVRLQQPLQHRRLEQHTPQVPQHLLERLRRAECGRVVLGELQREEGLLEDLEQLRVERVLVLAQLAVGRVDRQREAEPLQRRGVARQAEEAQQQRAHVERALRLGVVVLDRVLDELAEAARGELALARALRVGERTHDGLEQAHRRRAVGVLVGGEPVDDLEGERLEEGAGEAVGVGGEAQHRGEEVAVLLTHVAARLRLARVARGVAVDPDAQLDHGVEQLARRHLLAVLHRAGRQLDHARQQPVQVEVEHRGLLGTVRERHLQPHALARRPVRARRTRRRRRRRAAATAVDDAAAVAADGAEQPHDAQLDVLVGRAARAQPGGHIALPLLRRGARLACHLLLARARLVLARVGGEAQVDLQARQHAWQQRPQQWPQLARAQPRLERVERVERQRLVRVAHAEREREHLGHAVGLLRDEAAWRRE